jgi:hypothetical protein
LAELSGIAKKFQRRCRVLTGLFDMAADLETTAAEVLKFAV